MRYNNAIYIDIGVSVLSHKVWNRLGEFSRDMARVRIGVFSAACAFYLFLSMVPIIILCCSILPYTRLTEEELLGFLSLYLPNYTDQLVEQIVGDVFSGSAVMLPLSAVATLWSSGKAFSALIRGVEEVYSDPRRDHYLKRRALGIVYTLILIVMFLFCVALMLFGERVQVLAVERFSWLAKPVAILVDFRYLISIFLLCFVFCLVYKWIPSYKLKLWAQFPGAAFASCAWVIFTFALNLYISRFSGFSTYGSLTTIIIVMFWLYYGMYFVLMGGYINFYWDTRVRAQKHNSIRTQRLL